MKKSMAGLGTAALAVGTLGAVLGAPGPASAVTPTVSEVTFTGEATGTRPNGYTVVPSAVHFYNTTGAQVTVGDAGAASHGQGLWGSSGPGALEMRLTGPTTAISLAFGYDNGMDATDQAQLTVYRGATQVGQVEVNVNANNVMDQRINYGGGRLFNRAVFRYVDAAGVPKSAYEVIDDIKLNPVCTVSGDDGDNFLRGTAQRDVICGDTGNDTVLGGGGDDLIYPGPGWDRVNGDRGADTILDSAGNDRLNGNDGGDDVRAGVGRDVVRGGTGHDRLDGGPERDACHGDAGRDTATRCEVRRSIP